VLLAAAAGSAHGQTPTIEVDLQLGSGGRLQGLVVDHNDDAVVVVAGQTPYVFGWDEVEGPSAYVARRDLLILARGGAEHLSAEDHLGLGIFALRRRVGEAALEEFGKVRALDRTLEPKISAATDAERARRREETPGSRPFHEGRGAAEPGAEASTPQAGLTARLAELDALKGRYETEQTPAPVREAVRGVYEAFGAQVCEVMGPSVVRLESDHFLIWTDCDPRTREQLRNWCEATYRELCTQFGLYSSGDIFLAKCPLFCWRSRARFLKFAREFDGYDGQEAVGYSRSIPERGHVHLVLLLPGRSREDLDRFAGTLVHEATHAFVHRLFAARLIPHWVNEGLAELMSERVLGPRCPAGEKAELLARQYVRYGWSIGDLIESSGPPAVHQYALAGSLVAYLEQRDRPAFVAFIRGLKEGSSIDKALAESYPGLTVAQLEADWRAWVRARA